MVAFARSPGGRKHVVGSEGIFPMTTAMATDSVAEAAVPAASSRGGIKDGAIDFVAGSLGKCFRALVTVPGSLSLTHPFFRTPECAPK